MKTLKIYFTSDMHGYVYPTDYLDNTKKNIGLLNCMNQFKKDGNTLIIDGGDTIQGSPFTNYLSGNCPDIHPMATIMNAAGYDYVTFGNHEFNYGYDYVKSYMTNIHAKCLCANIEDITGQIPIVSSDIKVLENGLTVGVIGFTTDFITRWERDSHLTNFAIHDVATRVKEQFTSIKEQSDLVIGIYHGGFEYDLETDTRLSHSRENIAYEICRDFDFDLLLTGHQHIPMDGQYVHGTFIAQTPHNATKFLELHLGFDETTGEKHFTSSLKEACLPPHPVMYDTFLSLEQNVQTWLDTPVGHLNRALLPSSHLEMALTGSPLANFINQIQFEETGADIVCTSFANVIKGFNANVTVRDILSTYPYPNTLMVLSITGEILKKALERSASYFDIIDGEVQISTRFLKPKVEHYNYDYFAHINYTFDLSKPLGERVTSITFQGKEVQLSDTFTLAMNNYRASGAGGYDFYGDCDVIKEFTTEMPELIINYFKAHNPVVVDESNYVHVIQ